MAIPVLTVVNEHSEVLGPIEDDRARELPNSNIDDRGDRESDLLNSNIDDSDTELPNSNNIDNPDQKEIMLMKMIQTVNKIINIT